MPTPPRIMKMSQRSGNVAPGGGNSNAGNEKASEGR